MEMEIKIWDFGLSWASGATGNERCGSLGFVAPEVMNKKYYNEKVDVYSCGIVMFMLLVGYNPFLSDARYKRVLKNKEGKIEFRDFEWHRYSPDAMKLWKALTAIKAIHRLTAARALEHEWFSD